MSLTQERKAITLGAKLLDRILPGWHKKINLQKLDMADGTLCMMGQLFGAGVESKLATTMYPEEVNAARRNGIKTPHGYITAMFGWENTDGAVIRILTKLGLRNDLISEFTALQHVCAGHDNKCLWAEAIAERIVADDEKKEDRKNERRTAK